MFASTCIHDQLREPKVTGVRTAMIIGGGIAGPVVASALRKAGIESTIFEAYPSVAHGVGGTLLMAPNGLDALRIVGASAALNSIRQPIT